MNLNSQYTFYPPQPDNPTDDDRYYLLKHTLAELGWPQDMKAILNKMAPPAPVTGIAAPGSLRGVRVGVLGGGLAGLSAAYELRKTGCDVTVFDALTDRVGGRVYTWYFGDKPGTYGEFGPMRIPLAHETVWHYLKQFQLPTTPFIQTNPNGFAYLKKTRVRNDAAGANVMKYIYPKYELSPRERQTNWQTLYNIGTNSHLLRATTEERLKTIEVRYDYRGRALEWINKSNIEMMEAANLTQGAISLVSNFAPLLVGNLYNSFIDYIQENYPADVSYLYTIPGGIARLPAAFYDSFFNSRPYEDIPAELVGSVDYRPGCLITGLYLGTDGQVTLRYRTGLSGSDVDAFDYVVCAIPFSTLRNIDINPLFSGLKMRAIREVNYTPSQKTLVFFRERFWEKQGIVAGPSYTDLPINSIWYTNDHAALLKNAENMAGDIERLDTNAPGVIIASYNFGLDTTRLLNQPEDVLLDEVVRELAEVHGLPESYIRDNVIGFKAVNWDEEPTFRGALTFYSEQQKRLFSYAMTLPEYDGRVFFAGEHISAVHRWMQGALQTGMQAANDLAAASIQQRRK
jgi:monoamine oxidase